MKAKKIAVRDAAGNLHVVEIGGDDEAIAALEEAVSAEEAARQAAITAAINAEATAREQAISAETTAREQAISAEATARQQAITAAINAEAAARAQAINALGVGTGETPLVFGSTNGQAGKFDRQTAAPTATTALRYNGYFRATRVYGMYYSDNADYAEAYHVEGVIAPGDLVAIGEGGRLRQNNIRGNPAVVGIVSTAPASVIGADEGNETPIALAGRVPVWCVGKIRAGDFLMGASVPGAVEKATAIAERGAIVAQALEDKDSEGMRKIMALVVRM